MGSAGSERRAHQMKDGRLRGSLKRIVRAMWTVEMMLRRRLRRLGKGPRYQLGGACQTCAKCCEAPSIQVGRVVWHLPATRRLFLWWQRVVNGFGFVSSERETRTLVFACSHFDLQTRRCDSYASRPFMCRDYPRLLLDQDWPELFDECGYRAVARNNAGLRAAIDGTDLSPEKKAALAKKLHVVE